jgi:6-phosphogluconolactonase
MNYELQQFADADELSNAAAGSIVSALDDALKTSDRATLVLSGGSTPNAVYAKLASDPFRLQVNWSKVHFFWGDERCVPPTHPESNYRMASETLLDKLSIADTNRHRIKAEYPPEVAAAMCEEDMKTFFDLQEHQHPRFDVMLLGMGEDGHTASLFPGTTLLNETDRVVADVFVSKLNAHRITMTLPTINHARTILILVAGSTKAAMLREVLEGAPARYPIQHVQPVGGTLHWLVDREAASFLQQSQFHKLRSHSPFH